MGVEYKKTLVHFPGLKDFHRVIGYRNITHPFTITNPNTTLGFPILIAIAEAYRGAQKFNIEQMTGFKEFP